MGDERERRQSGKVLIPILFARSERVTLIPHVKVATIMKEEQYNGIMKRLLEWRRESPREAAERRSRNENARKAGRGAVCAVIPAAAESVRACVRACMRCKRECEARRSDAVRVGSAWLQRRHGCGFVTCVKLEARGGRDAKAKRNRGKW